MRKSYKSCIVLWTTGEEPPDPDGSDFEVVEKKSIPDDQLWKMFGTGVSFRALSTILNASFKVKSSDDYFYTSTSYLYKNYTRLLKTKEREYKHRLAMDKSYGSICFDHQNTRRLTGKYEGTTHRLAVVWYSKQSHNVLGMIKMPDKTAEAQTITIQKICEEFNIDINQIIAFVCDNENTNVGIRGGTCSLLETVFQREFLRAMCRHHIMEIVIKDVYKCLFDGSTPENVFYPILKQYWDFLRETDFPVTKFNDLSFILDKNEHDIELFNALKVEAISELRGHSKSNTIRDDYKEVTTLALAFFGENQNLTKGNQVKFRTLIKPSNARFMASIIQGLECFLFRRSFDWLPEDKEMRYNLMRFSAFASLIYIRYWDRCTNLFDAPSNDLNLLKALQIYKRFDEPIADAAMLALSRHLNHMSEELSPLALFSDKISLEDKNSIAEKMCVALDKTMPQRRMIPPSNDISFSEGIGDVDYDWSSKTVANLIGDRSPFLFHIMNLPCEFLRQDSREWKKLNDYNHAKKTIQNALICINDGSERVISNCKNKFQKQRCRKETTFRQNLMNLHLQN